jgi:hypothetical protein
MLTSQQRVESHNSRPRIPKAGGIGESKITKIKKEIGGRYER